MAESLAVLFGVALLCGLGVWLIVVPIILLDRTKRLGDLRARLDRVERAVQRLRREGVVQAAETAAPPTEVLVVAEATEVPTPPAPRLTPRALAPATRVSEPTTFDWEIWLGRRGLGWLAVIVLLFAVAFFLKYAFENDWVGPLGRVGIGMLAGSALCVAGYRYHRKDFRIFGQMLTSAGVLLLYLSTFAAFGYYQLLPRERAGVFLILIVAEAAGLALLYEAPAIAIMAIIGGLLNPVLLRTGHDPYRTLFLYLFILDLGAVLLVILRPSWPALGTIALAGTQLLFGLWYEEHFHPDKLTAALLFQCGVFGVFLLPSIASTLRRRSVDIETLARLILNACLFTAMLYVLLNDDYHQWMGTIALGLAIVYAALAWLLSRTHFEDQRHLFTAVAVAVGLLGTVIFWQANASWVAVGWASGALGLWWFGLRIQALPLRLLGAVLMLLAIGRFLFVDTPGAHPAPFTPVFNFYGTPAIVMLACLFAASAISRTSSLASKQLDHVGMWMAGIAGVLLGWMVVSLESFDYFTVQAQPPSVVQGMVVDAGGRSLTERLFEEDMDLHRTALMSLSLVWAIYAGVVLVAGFLRRNPPLRWAALALFGITLCKVFLFDMGQLPGFYRIAAFFGLAVVLGIAARIYQNVQQPSVATAERKMP